MLNQKKKNEEEWLNAQSNFLINGSFTSSNPEIQAQIELIEDMPEGDKKIEEYRYILDTWRETL